MSAYQAEALMGLLGQARDMLADLEVGASGVVRQRLAVVDQVQQVVRLVSAGVDEAEALLRVAGEFGSDVRALREAWSVSRRRDAARERQHKLWTIRRMRSLGYGNPEIARVVGYHEKHIPRVLREAAAVDQDAGGG